jgi:hypothetical protein
MQLGNTFCKFVPLKTLDTNISISAALKNAIATEDALWESGMPESPHASPPISTVDLPPNYMHAPSHGSRPSPTPIANTHASLPANRHGAISTESLSDLSDLSELSDLDRAQDGSSPAPDTSGKKRKRSLTQAVKQARRERHRKQRATETSKAKRRERRKVLKSNKPPTERRPHFPKGHSLPQTISGGIRPLPHFPVVSTGYTGDKNVESILDKQIWTLEMLIERGLEVFEWDGR